MKKILLLIVLYIGITTSVHASHVINDSGKSGDKILITDMFWGGKNCGGQDLKFEIVNGPKNGKLIQEKKKENLDVKKLKVTSALTCDGKILTISYVYYQSKTGFKGKDEFTVRWTTVGNPSPGQIREKTYKIDVK